MRGLRPCFEAKVSDNHLSTETEPRFEGIETCFHRSLRRLWFVLTETEPRFEGIETNIDFSVALHPSFRTETEPRFEGIETSGDRIQPALGDIPDGDRAPI